MEIPPLIQRMEGNAESLKSAYTGLSGRLKELRSDVQEAKSSFAQFEGFIKQTGIGKVTKEIAELNNQLRLLKQGFTSTQQAVSARAQDTKQDTIDRELASSVYSTHESFNAGGSRMFALKREQQRAAEAGAVLESLALQKERAVLANRLDVADKVRAIQEEEMRQRIAAARTKATVAKQAFDEGQKIVAAKETSREAAEGLFGIKYRDTANLTPEQEDDLLAQRARAMNRRYLGTGMGGRPLGPKPPKDDKGGGGKDDDPLLKGFGKYFAFHTLQQSITQFMEGWQHIATSFIQFKTTVIQGLGQAASQFAGGMITGTEHVLGGLFSGLEEAVKGLLHGDVVGGSIRGFAKTLSETVKGIGAAAHGAVSGVTHALSTLVGGAGAAEGAQTAGMGQMAGAGISAVGLAGFAVNPIVGFVTTAISSMVGNVVSSAARMMGEIQSMLAQMAASVLSTVGSLVAQILQQVTAAASAAIAAVLGVFADFASTMATKGMQVERFQAIFATLTQSAMTGKRVFAELQQMSIFTPYTVETLSEVSQELLAVGISVEQLNPVLTRLGQIALGDGNALKNLAKLFGDVAEGGKLTQFRMREFAKAGLTAKDFAETMGVSIKEFQRQLTTGGVGPDVVAGTINRLTDAGGRFSEANQRMMQTAQGQWHRLNSIIETTAQKMGEAFNESSGLARGLKAIGDFIDENSEALTKFAAAAGEFIGDLAKEFAHLGKAIIGQMNAPNFKMPSAREVIDKIMDGLEEFVVGIVKIGQFVSEAASTIKEMFGVILSTIGKTIEDLAGDMMEQRGDMRSIMKPKAREIMETIGLNQQQIELFAKPLEALGKKMQGFGKAVGPAGVAVGAGVPGAAPGGFIAQMQNFLSPEGMVRAWFAGMRNRGAAPAAPGIPGAFGVPGHFTVPGGGGFGFGGIGRQESAKPIGNEKQLSERAQKMQKDIATKEVEGTSAIDKFRKAMAAADEIEKDAKKGFGAGGVGGAGEGGLGIRKQMENQNKALQVLLKGTGRARFDAFQDLAKNAGGQPSSLPTAAEYGSVEAVDAINKSNMDNYTVLQQMAMTMQAGVDQAAQAIEAEKTFQANINEFLAALAAAGIK